MKKYEIFSKELLSAQQKLVESIGSDMKIYYNLLKSWFKKKISKDEFDLQARELFTAESIHLHNNFLLALFSKCQSLEVSAKKKKKFKNKSSSSSVLLESHNMNQQFLHVDPLSVAPQIPLLPQLDHQSSFYVMNNGLLPIKGQIEGRLLVGVWERGMENLSSQCASLLFEAMNFFLKNIISKLLIHTNHFNKRNGFCHSFGAKASSSSLLPLFSNRFFSTQSNKELQIELKEGGYISLPLGYQGDQEEEEALKKISLMNQIQFPFSHNITAIHLLDFLIFNRLVFSCYSIHISTIERLINKLWHPSEEEPPFRHSNIQQNQLSTH